MKNKLNNMYNIISNRFYFKILYLFISISFVSLLTIIPGIKLLNKLILIWGVLLILCHLIDVVTKKRNLHIFDIIIYSFVILTIVLTLFNYPTGENIKTWLVNCILLFSVFSIEKDKGKKKLKEELDIISVIFVSFTFATSVISLILMYVPKTMDYVKSLITSIDFTNYAGFYSNSNTLGIIAGISFAITIYLILNTANNKFKYILSFNLALQLFTLIVSKCRSSIFIILALIFAFVFIKFKNKFIRTGLIALPTGLLFYISTHLHSFMSFLTGRYDLWYTAYNLLHYWPTTGVGYSNMVPMMNYYKVATELAYLPGIDLGGIHNIYMQTAVINGLFALVLLLAIFISMLTFIIKRLDTISNKLKPQFTVLLGLLLGILLINLMESSLLYIISFISMIFWIYAGYVMGLVEKEE